MNHWINFNISRNCWKFNFKTTKNEETLKLHIWMIDMFSHYKANKNDALMQTFQNYTVYEQTDEKKGLK